MYIIIIFFLNGSLVIIFNIYYDHNLICIISFILVVFCFNMGSDSFACHPLAFGFVCHKL